MSRLNFPVGRPITGQKGEATVNRPHTQPAILITGAAKRLGRHLAEDCATHGWDVAIHYHHSRDDAQQVAEAIRRQGRRAVTIRADLADPQQTAELVTKANEQLGPLKALINNASIFPKSSLAEMDLAALQANIGINAYAPLQLCRTFAAQPNATGSIINMLDTRFIDYDRQHVAYHLSKRMLFSLTCMLAIELAPSIRVNAIAPGLILPPPGEDDAYLERLRHTNPLQAIGTPAQICAAARFLLETEFVCGQTLFIDGGRHLKSAPYGST